MWSVYPFECTTIGKIESKWTYQRFTEKSWLDWVTSEIQAVRGRKVGKIGGKLSKRKSVTESERTLQPWLDLGISRANILPEKMHILKKKAIECIVFILPTMALS